MLLALLAAKAFAEPVEASPAQPLLPPQDAPLADGTRERTPPDYPGQERPTTTTGDVLIWGPRVILLPAYLVTEYVVRAPVGGLATAAEKDNWGPSVFNFFAFGPDHKYGIFPVFLFNFGFRPSIGAHFFWDDAIAKGNNFTTDVGYGGSNWITVGLGDRYTFSKNNWLAVETRWDRRPDNLFYDPTIQQRVDAGQYSAPPGYGLAAPSAPSPPGAGRCSPTSTGLRRSGWGTCSTST